MRFQGGSLQASDRIKLTRGPLAPRAEKRKSWQSCLRFLENVPGEEGGTHQDHVDSGLSPVQCHFNNILCWRPSWEMLFFNFGFSDDKYQPDPRRRGFSSTYPSFLGFPASIATSIGRSLEHNYWLKAQVTKVLFTSHNTQSLTGTSAPNWRCLACWPFAWNPHFVVKSTSHNAENC